MTFREMLTEDLDQVMEIETDLFAMPWTKEGMFTFLTREDTMFFVVEEKNRILGYCSMQTVLDEGDILNVAVCRDRQKEGIGYFLVNSMLMLAETAGGVWVFVFVFLINIIKLNIYNTIWGGGGAGRKKVIIYVWK